MLLQRFWSPVRSHVSKPCHRMYIQSLRHAADAPDASSKLKFRPVPDHIRNAVAGGPDENLSSKRKEHKSYKSLLEATRKYVCRIETYNTYLNKEYIMSSGSGFIFHPDGYIATSTFCTGNQPVVRVLLNDGSRMNGNVEWFNDRINVAIIKVEGKMMPSIEMSSSGDNQVVAIAGEPVKNHLVGQYFFPTTAIKGQMNWLEAFYDEPEPLNYGHVGGPVVNPYAQAVGICHMNYEEEPVVLPIEYIKYYMIKKPDKNVDRAPRLRGLLFFEITAGFLNDFEIPALFFRALGVAVVQSVPGCPAQVCGLQVNDVIFRINGRKATAINVDKLLSSQDDVTMEIKRFSESINIFMPADMFDRGIDVDYEWR